MISKQFEHSQYYLWITLLALGLRVAWALLIPVVPVSDGNAYDVFAQNLANCQNYGWDCQTPTAYWPVGVSFVYSLLYRMFGHTYGPIILLNLLLAVVTIWLSMYLAEQWFGRRTAAITGILLALWPSQIQFTTVLASEQLFGGLVVAALALWNIEQINLRGRAGIVGILLAGASYVRPTALLIPILLMFFRYMRTRKIIENLAATMVMFTVVALLIAPWSLRNMQVFGKFVLISTNGGANLWMGNNPASTGGYMELPPNVNGMNEAERDTYLKNLATDHIQQQPLLFARRTVQRVFDTYSRESIGVAWNEEGLKRRFGERILTPLKLLSLGYWLPVLILGLIGVGLLFQATGGVGVISHPTVLLWAYFTAINALIVAQDRYHFPSIPFIAVLAAFTLNRWLPALLKDSDRAPRD